MGDVIYMPRKSDLAARIFRADAIRDAIAKKPKFPLEDEHLTAARNLHRVLERAKRTEGFDIHKVLQDKDVNLAGNGLTDSTKRLREYTLPENATDQRIAAIAKKPGKYLQIANAVAAELDEHEAVLVAQVFEGCSIGSEYLGDGDWDSENWSRLAALFKSMANAVIRDHGLDEYWRKVRATNGIYDVRADTFRTAPGPLWLFSDGWGLAGESECSDETPPVPSIPLGRRMQGEPVAGWIFFDADDSTEVEFLFWLEVRLALGPVNDQSSGPIFEFRTVIEGRLEDGRVVRFDNPHTDTTDRVTRAYIGEDDFAIHGLGIDPETPVIEPEFRDETEHSYFSWRELNPALLRYLFGPAEKKFAEVVDPIKRHEGVWVQDLPPSRFSRGSAAGVLHTDLLTGALETELGDVCDRLTDQLDALRAEQDRAIRDAETEAMDRWAPQTTTENQRTET